MALRLDPVTGLRSWRRRRGLILGRRARVAALAAVGALVVALVPPNAAGAQPSGLEVPESAKRGTESYIVQLVEEPVASYRGGRRGLSATSPRAGAKIDPDSTRVGRYVRFLENRQAAVMRSGGVSPDAKLYDYQYSFNGFAAQLTTAEAARLAANPAVVSVFPDELRQPLTDNTPDFLGLTGPDGLWEQLGGPGSAGEDVIIGVIDSGIWPEHPSFSDQSDLVHRRGRSGDRLRVYDEPTDWNGICEAGERFSPALCNNKLIGARYFRKGAGAATVSPEEYLSPRDHDGHGTHTASTAGGNADVSAEIFGVDRGVVSGMAPRARIAAYKVCWDGAGCFLSDIVAAIDIAVADGVDVINYSIGGGPTTLLSADAVAFLSAADAGVFVATSAGNSGPDATTVGHPATAPWVTTVGASTQSRLFEGTVSLGDGSAFTGASLTGGTEELPIVDSVDAGSELCIPGELDEAVVAGTIVLCARGEIARVDKSRAVAEAGGAGLVLYNTVADQDIDSDNHFVPSVHVPLDAGTAIKEYIAAEGASATAQLGGGTKVADPTAPSMAAFSSRGPNPVVGDVIKPDVTAPGVNVLAGNTPTPFLGAPDQLFQAISGTSMSSPHVAGVGALLRQVHPEWTPEMIRSALMTTGHQDVTKEDGQTAADPFDIGAGHVAPTPAAAPGLVYDTGFADYVAFLCGVEELDPESPTCDEFGSIDPSDLNLPSLGVDGLAGVQTITRTVTNVGPAGTYAVSVDAPPGIDVSVEPSTLTLDAGASESYAVTLTSTDDAAFEEWAFGSLTWSDGVREVRSPLAVRPVAVDAPDDVQGAGPSGTASWDVTFGYTGSFAAAPHGLIPADTETRTIVDDPANDINAALSSGVGVEFHPISVPSGTRHLRASLFDAETDGDDDLDLYLFDPDGELVDGSFTATSAEQVDASRPQAGEWTVVVHAWQSDGPDAVYTAFSWELGDADEGNLTVASAPDGATLGESGVVEIAWSGLEPGTRYLGSVSYSNASGEIDETLVSVSG